MDIVNTSLDLLLVNLEINHLCIFRLIAENTLGGKFEVIASVDTMSIEDITNFNFSYIFVVVSLCLIIIYEIVKFIILIKRELITKIKTDAKLSFFQEHLNVIDGAEQIFKLTGQIKIIKIVGVRLADFVKRNLIFSVLQITYIFYAFFTLIMTIKLMMVIKFIVPWFDKTDLYLMKVPDQYLREYYSFMTSMIWLSKEVKDSLVIIMMGLFLLHTFPFLWNSKIFKELRVVWILVLNKLLFCFVMWCIVF